MTGENKFFTRDVLQALKLYADGKPYLKEPTGDEKVYQSLEQRVCQIIAKGY